MWSATKRRRLAGLLLAFMLAGVLGYPAFLEAFAPMKQNESQCLLCHRERVEKWICSTKVSDTTTANEYSDWVDSFYPAGHSHQWMISTNYYRGHWFGNKSIGCGGIATIAHIYRKRDSLGEQDAQRLIAKWHLFVAAKPNLRAMDQFASTLASDPRQLLEND